ncbi:hypothetical protein RhiirA5_441077 [Rhizophagus irregularis]|uniref:Uncharacterized protein n=1 Tax=Rhizophagus irregularis TaxID=588596 RepID=A0A2N0NG42_9GLOM|nr:hypothetical protein RhiirA5_441077 [Rhizophagus irregularis]
MKKGSIRILGVWFNAFNKKDHAFRTIFKNKLGLAQTEPNDSLKNFHNNQLQAKITNFILQLNDKMN